MPPRRTLMPPHKGAHPDLPGARRAGCRCRRGPLAALLCCWLLAACTPAAPPFLTHPELPQLRDRLQRVGLIPPSVTMAEEQARYQLVPHPDWGEEATRRLVAAFVAEAAARELPLTVLDAADPQVAEVSDLFATLEIGLLAHDYRRGGGHVSDEPLAGVPRPFRYGIGPLDDLLAAEHLDGVWLITARNLLPTPAARLGDAGQVTMAILAGLALVPAPVLILDKFELHGALFDREGRLLFHGVVADLSLPAAPSSDDETTDSLPLDLRRDEVARTAVKALLRLYRQGVTP